MSWINKNPTTRQRRPPFQSLVRGVQETAETLQTTAIAFGCLPELECKTLLLKTLHTLDTGLRGTELQPSWKPPPGELALTESEGVRQLWRGKSN